MVWERLETDSNISITYTREAYEPSELAEVEVCYEVNAGGKKLFGLVSLVRGNWYVTVPSEYWLRGKCPVERVVFNSSIRS